MLSIKTMSGDRAGYYLALGHEDYYTKGGEPPGVWLGKGAAMIGLTGRVEASHLQNLFRGYSPDGTHPVVEIQSSENGNPEHRPGFDLTFSAPKAVSVLWAQASPHLRIEIQKAQFEAVKAGISFIEETIAAARRGKGGHLQETASLIVATFEHGTSRALDPHLHTHALLMNAGIRHDGTFSTLDGRQLLLAKMAAGALYRVELCYQLERLGLSVERDRFSFEVVGVPQPLCEFYSHRRAEIEDELLRTGLTGARAADMATILTRRAKEVAPRSELLRDWKAKAAEFGWSTRKADALFKGIEQSRDFSIESTEAVSMAIQRLTEREAHFSELEFIRRLGEESQCRGLSASDVRNAAESSLGHSPEIVGLGARDGHRRYTTPEMIDLERTLLEEVRELRANHSHQVSADEFVRFLRNHGELHEEQMRALHHITTNASGITLLCGVAGAGKTYVLGKARELWESCGFEVIGTALAGKATRQLAEESGIKSRNVAQLLTDVQRGKNPLNHKSILVVDEAGMIDTRTWLKLAQLCKTSGAKLCAVGHEQQLQPIGPGNPLPEIGARHGMARLIQNKRQREAWLREVVGHVMDGRAQPALRELVQRGMLTVHPTKFDAMAALIQRWSNDALDPTHSVIIAGTRRDVAKLNALAQESMIAQGRLSGPGVPLRDLKIYAGDHVVFTKTSAPRGIEKGTRGKVLSANAESCTVTIRSDFGDQVTVSLNHFPHLDLGYAMTTHGVQGSTLQYAYALPGGPMQDRELTYVQISRAKVATRLFVTAAEAGEEISDFARQIARSRQKEMAHTVLRKQDLQQNADSHFRIH